MWKTQKRRLPVLDHRLVDELTVRDVAGEVHVKNTATLLSLLLRVTPGQAAMPG